MQVTQVSGLTTSPRYQTMAWHMLQFNILKDDAKYTKLIQPKPISEQPCYVLEVKCKVASSYFCRLDQLQNTVSIRASLCQSTTE